MAITLKTPAEIMLDISKRAKKKRLQENLSQSGLAERSGVSLGSLKRFESTGQISLESLLKIALSLNCLSDFNTLFSSVSAPISLFTDSQIIKPRKRGLLK